jgi:hypothetical protein
MPNTKQFEAFDLNEVLFGSGKITKLSMVEISEIFFLKINEIYKYLEEGKMVSIEVPEKDMLATITKIDSNHFVLACKGDQPISLKHLSAIEMVNWIFATAPFMAMVGYSNIG